jgi:N6-L-threonylcarbamoyladenine synthase
VTRGPGLVGALLVGLAYAKALAFSRMIPFVGVNHLEGHIYSVFLDHPDARIPALSLVVSGGHTNLYHLERLGRYKLVAKTRDDAAGEALDKLAKKLGLGYPGGPIIQRLARFGNPGAYQFTLPKITDRSLDFSFSGIKTAALRLVKEEGIEAVSRELAEAPEEVPDTILGLVASYQAAIIEQLIHRVVKALEIHEVDSIHVSGGVSCNTALRESFSNHFGGIGIPVYFPQPALTTDNAAMIAAAAFYRLRDGAADPWDLPADPNLRVTEVSNPE